MISHAAPRTTAAFVWHKCCSALAYAEIAAVVTYMVYTRSVVTNTDANLKCAMVCCAHPDPPSAHVRACKQAVESKMLGSASMFRMLSVGQIHMLHIAVCWRYGLGAKASIFFYMWSDLLAG